MGTQVGQSLLDGAMAVCTAHQSIPNMYRNESKNLDQWRTLRVGHLLLTEEIP